MANELSCLKEVSSSMFSRAGYDESNWNLLLEFKSTKEVRCYRNVSPEMADALLSAESIGKWWNANVKGNPGWEFEILASAEPPASKEPKPEPPSGITDDDIRTVDPNYSRTNLDVDKTIIYSQHPDGSFTELDGIPADTPVPPHVWPTYGGINRANIGMDGTDPGSLRAITTQTHGELLGKWTAPETAAEALDLLEERAAEITALIANNTQAGQFALATKIIDADTRLSASKLLDTLVEAKDRSALLLDPFRKVLYEAYTYAGGKVNAAVVPLENGLKHVKSQIISWDQEQERIRQRRIREANEAAEAEARRRQEAERERLTLAEVDDALEQGHTERAQELFDNPIEVPKPFVQPEYIAPTAPAIQGQSSRSNWRIVEEEIDMVAFLRAVKEGKFPLDQAAELVLPNKVELNRLAKALKTAFNVPGVRAEDQGSISVRRKR